MAAALSDLTWRERRLCASGRKSRRIRPAGSGAAVEQTTYRLPASELTPGVRLWHGGRWHVVTAAPEPYGRVRVAVRLRRHEPVVLRTNTPVAVRS